jgi:hypothetical protein
VRSRANQAKRRAGQENACAVFNRDIPTGSPVWLILDNGERLSTKTRSVAWQLGDGSPVVLVEGKTGGWHIERVVLRTTEAP